MQLVEYLYYKDTHQDKYNNKKKNKLITCPIIFLVQNLKKKLYFNFFKSIIFNYQHTKLN